MSCLLGSPLLLIFVSVSLVYAKVAHFTKEQAQEEPAFQEKYFDQFIDHFNFRSNGDNTYKQRYLITEQYWKGHGPIFFYTGNEGDITGFQRASGLLTDLAPKFGALVVFAEHRYYGKSMPFGEDSFTGDNIGLLMMDQAMADYAYLMKYLKSKHCSGGPCPIIAFGGSYGGMLAAYMRFKYPNFVEGALSASAPIYWVTGHGDRHGFFKSVTDQFQKSSQECVNKIKKGFADTQSLANQGRYSEIGPLFHTCQEISPSNLEHLYGWVRNSYTSLAMMNYPYPTNLLAPLPGYPVNVACDEIMKASSAVTGLALGAGVFYNGTSAASNSLTCFDIEKEFIDCADPTGCGLGNDAKAWDYQACTEIILPGGSTNVTDMFPMLPFTLEMRNLYCEKHGVTPRNTWGDIHFWGPDILSSSNIIFSNGELDPWGPGGVHKNLSDSLIALEVQHGAHHLDLRGSNPKDPQSVIQVREQEAAIISGWVNAFFVKHGGRKIQPKV